MTTDSPRPLRRHAVWDAPTRALHWINAFVILCTAALGLLFMFRGNLAIEGGEAKIALKQIHSYFGYVVAIGLLTRLSLGFWGNRHVRWRAVLPTKASLEATPAEAAALMNKGEKAAHFLGHGPIGRLSSTALLLVATAVMGTGLIRAGTDLFLPPFGGAIATYAAADDVDPAEVTPFNYKETLDEGRGHRVLQLKLIAGPIHEYGSLLLLALIVLHVAGLTLKELRQGGGLLSSMVSGYKTYPEDEEIVDEGGP